jgi:hypothetical protein
VTFYLAMLVFAALGSGAYLALFFSHVPGAADERLGDLEPLPDRIGEWVTASEPNQDGLIRQERILFEDKGGGRGTLTTQVRFRDPKTDEIVSVLPEVVTKRRRVKKAK